MKKIEIEEKFDEIIKFAETEKFLDMPLKHYSSGMQVRLGFAVAAHLEPEILIIDEVLAVGDAEFQKKCLGKMGEISRQGKTVLFVSHNLAAVQGLCERGIVLRSGQVIFDGDVDKSIEYYLSGNSQLNNTPVKDRVDRTGNGKVRLTDIKVLNKNNEETNHIFMGEDFSVEITTTGKLNKAIIGVLIGNTYRTQMIRGYTWENISRDFELNGTNVLRCHFQNFPMMHGSYDVHVWIGQYHDLADYVEHATSLHVEPVDFYSNGKLLDPTGGVAFCRVKWMMDGTQL